MSEQICVRFDVRHVVVRKMFNIQFAIPNINQCHWSHTLNKINPVKTTQDSIKYYLPTYHYVSQSWVFSSHFFGIHLCTFLRSAPFILSKLCNSFAKNVIHKIIRNNICNFLLDGSGVAQLVQFLFLLLFLTEKFLYTIFHGYTVQQ